MIPSVDSDDRNWAIYANAAGLLVFTNIPLANVIATFLVWLKVHGDATKPFARAHATTALNFQLTWTIFTICFFALLFAIAAAGGGRFATLFPIIIAAYFALAVLNVIMCIIGCARASDVKGYRYPLSIPFVR
jgi:uncharacterized Tic20 family protein